MAVLGLGDGAPGIRYLLRSWRVSLEVFYLVAAKRKWFLKAKEFPFTYPPPPTPNPQLVNKGKNLQLRASPVVTENMFGGTTSFGQSTLFGSSNTTNTNPMKDVEVSSPPDDSVSCLKFSPGVLASTFLVAGSWDNHVRCWEVHQSGQTTPKAQQTHTGPVLDVDWSDDGTKVFTASCDKTVKMWDLNSNQAMQVAQHDAPVKTVHWIKAPNYSCVMTGSWDKTLKFWDTRSSTPILSIQLPERVYCADVKYPMAVVGLAGRAIVIYQLDVQPQEFKRMESPLKYQHRCVSIFNDKKTNAPTGFALRQ
ncbi:Poly(A)+ RNA export protein rae1 [Bulinus truncatus]|nr:Poly(A)+ RNA export protein rae1 [Bulinus truncatus]